MAFQLSSINSCYIFGMISLIIIMITIYFNNTIYFNYHLLIIIYLFPKFRPVSGSLMEPEAGVEEPPLIQATPELELAAVEDDSSDEAPWPPWDVATCGDFKRKFHDV